MTETVVATNDMIHGLFKKIALADDVAELQVYIERGKRMLPAERHSEMMFSVFSRMYRLSAVDGLESVMDEAADYLEKRGESYRLCRDCVCTDEFFMRVVAHPVFGKTNLDLMYCTPAQLQIYLTTGVPKTVNNFLYNLTNLTPINPEICKMIMEIYRLFGADPNFPRIKFMEKISVMFNQRYENTIKVILEASDVGITPNTRGQGDYTLLDWYVTPNQLWHGHGKRKDMTLEFGRYLLEKGADPRICDPGHPYGNALYWLRQSVFRREVNSVAMFYLFKGPVTWTETGIGHDKDSSHRIEVDPVSGLIHYQELSIAGVKDITGKVRVVNKQTEIYKEVETLPADRVIVNPDGTYTIIEVLTKLNETFGLQ